MEILSFRNQIVNETEYFETLQAIERLMSKDPEKNTPSARKLEALVKLVLDYEKEQQL